MYRLSLFHSHTYKRPKTFWRGPLAPSR
ncbi:hypothetical protein CGRA01v4_01841 [Colletotrichum graminicola]|nr:hypothetical protein CGRA01v4_01841 [Colletotrichum graminicola]